MKGAKFQRWQEGEGAEGGRVEKKKLMNMSNQIRYLLLFY